MVKSELIRRLAQNCNLRERNLSYEDIKEFTNIFFSEMKRYLDLPKKRIVFRKFGTFRLAVRKPRSYYDTRFSCFRRSQKKQSIYFRSSTFLSVSLKR